MLWLDAAMAAALYNGSAGDGFPLHLPIGGISQETAMSVPQHLATFWAAFLTTTERSASTRCSEAFHFDDNEADANTLGALVVRGIKTATASLLWTFAAEQRRRPRIGDLSIVTTWQGEPLCVIETTAVSIQAFEDVEATFAAAEGEGDGSLRHWQATHWAYFARVCDHLGRPPTTRMAVVCERFRVVYPGGGRQDIPSSPETP
jgi:uncharacterized protein YhfF